MWPLLVILLVVLIYYKLMKPLKHWENQGIIYQKPWPILRNMRPVVLGTKPIIELVREFYNVFPDARYNGIYHFNKPALLIRDINLIKQITVKDFDYFTDHKQFVAEEGDPSVGKELFSLKGQKWRDMRATLSPSFTSSKMKAMFHLLSECVQNVLKYFEKEYSNLIVVEMKDLFTRYTNDAIASVAFGLKVNSLQERNNEFYLMGEEATNFSGLRALRFLLFGLCPSLMKYLGITFFPKHIIEFFDQIIKKTIQQREQQGIIRPDMIYLLMEARKGRLKHDDTEIVDSGFAVAQESAIEKTEIRHRKPELSDDITAQAFLFFFAGYDTASSLMTFLSYELALHPDVQTSLQEEIDEVIEHCNDKITYESILGMKYLDMVVSETLRKWPPGFQLDRICVKDYVIHPENKNEKAVTIRKGDLILISAIGIHHDPKYFADPDKFDLERFNDNNKRNILPYSYIPFGVGPRNCIGSRLALLEIKILIFHLLGKYDFTVVEKTQAPVKLAPKPFNMIPEKGMWLGIKKRKKVRS